MKKTGKLFVSKKILFLYFTPRHKSELILCEKAFRSVFRKFRKSVLFSYMQIDISPTCRDSFKEILFNEISRHDAVVINSDRSTSRENEIFTKEILGLFAAENHINGKVMCYPSSCYTSEMGKESVLQTQKTDFESIRKASSLSISLAKERKHSLTTCTNMHFGSDKRLFSELQRLSDKSLHISSEHLTLDEMIFLCMRAVPSFDVMLSTEETANIVAMHLAAPKKAYAGYLILHTKRGRVYLRQSFPHEEMSNAHLASVLTAFSAALENELEMKSAAQWFRKSVATVFETHAYVSENEFLDKVISEAEKPMRNRKR